MLQNRFVAGPPMPRSASKLAPTLEGGFIARKVIPVDIRDKYAKLYGQRTEERLNTGPMPVLLARAKHREWSSEIEARFANLRAARSGEGRSLTSEGSASFGWGMVRLVHHTDGSEQLAARRMGPFPVAGMLRALRSSDGWRRVFG
jgi:hypothetical protein